MKGKYVDSGLWQHGIVQRVRTKELKQFLKGEIAKFTSNLKRDQEEVAMHQANADKFDIEAATADADVVVIQAQLRALVDCVKAGKVLVRVLFGS